MASSYFLKAGKPAIVVAAKSAGGSPATCIWLHGLGDSGAGWAPAAVEWQQQCPHIKVRLLGVFTSIVVVLKCLDLPDSSSFLCDT